MSVDAYDFVHLALYAMGGEIDGKTRLQKVVYFLGVKTGDLPELGYRAHFYGPFSGLVAGAADRLCVLGFVDANTTVWGSNSLGFERYKTSYRLNDDGKVIAEAKKKAYPELWERLQKAAVILKHLGDVDYMKLSVAAKTHFMLDKQEKNDAGITELTEMASQFGWKVSEEEIKGAAHVLEALHLAKCQET